MFNWEGGKRYLLRCGLVGHIRKEMGQRNYIVAIDNSAGLCDPKALAKIENYIWDSFDGELQSNTWRYVGQTMVGTSGDPVFQNALDLTHLHPDNIARPSTDRKKIIEKSVQLAVDASVKMPKARTDRLKSELTNRLLSLLPEGI